MLAGPKKTRKALHNAHSLTYINMLKSEYIGISPYSFRVGQTKNDGHQELNKLRALAS